MIKKFLFITSVVFTVNSFGQITTEFGAPVVTLLSAGHWGSGVDPWLVIYENGQVIYQKCTKQKGGCKYFLVNFSKQETQDLIYSLGITKKAMRLPNVIDASNGWSDQTTKRLILNFDSIKTIDQTGSLHKSLRSRIRYGGRRRTSRSFLRIYDEIMTLKINSQNAKEIFLSGDSLIFENINKIWEKEAILPSNKLFKPYK